MTIYERAIELVPHGCAIGLGSGRAAWAFVGLLGDRIRAGTLNVHGVTASDETTAVAIKQGVPLVGLAEAGELAITVDGADEVAANLDLIKGYGRALLREKVIAASSRRLIILVSEEKLVAKLGSRGRLPVEVVPFAAPLCERGLAALGLEPVLWTTSGAPAETDNGNCIFDCGLRPTDDPARLDEEIRRIPGVVGTGFFLGLADIVLVGDRNFVLKEELKRQPNAIRN